MRNNATNRRLAILRVLADHQQHLHKQIEKACRRWMTRAEYLETMAELLRADLIAQSRDGYLLTRKGSRLLPSAAPVLPPMRPLQRPPEPPRRPGSDWRDIPSVYAGALQPYQAHV